MTVATTEQFFEHVFQDAVQPGREIVLFGGKRSSWRTTIAEAADSARAHAEHHDTYFHVALHDRDVALDVAQKAAIAKDKKPPSRIDMTRGCIESAVAIGGLWGDFDVAGRGHTQEGLPENEHVVISMFERLPHPPSIVLNTWGGLHAWWLFREPWIFDTAHDRELATKTSRGWQGFMRLQLGRTMDSTHDLARVMRMPGIISQKHGKMVEVMLERDARYNPSDFEQWVDEASSAKRAVARVGHFLIDPDASPPFDKLHLMMSLDGRFAATWNRKRKDLPSQSEYDLSLASMAVRAGWTDQHVVDLLVSHRRLGGSKEKLRPDYFLLTLGRARGDAEPHEASAQLAEKINAAPHRLEIELPETDAAAETIAPDRETTPASGETQPASNGTNARAGETAPPKNGRPGRDELVRDVRRVCGVPVNRLLKFLRDPPVYELHLENGGKITLGSVDGVLNAAIFRSKLAAATNHVMPMLKQAAWQPVSQALLMIAEDQDLGSESSDLELVREWVGAYLGKHPPSAHEQMDEACALRRPFEKSGCVHLFLEPLLVWCRIKGAADAKLGRFELARMLHNVGAERVKVDYHRGKDKQIRTKANGWRLPEDLP